MKNVIKIAVISILLASCGAKKNVVKEPEKPIDTVAPTSNNKEFFSEVLKKSSFESVKISSKIDAEIGKFVPTIDAVFYIENGQKVWANMSAFINVARGLATPEGLKAYERLNKTYIDSDFSYLNKLLNVNFIDYQSLQNLLVGKVFIPMNEKDFSVTQNAQGYILTSQKNQKVVLDGKTSEYQVEINYDTQFNLQKVLLKDAKSPDFLEISYQNWTTEGTEKFPKNVKILIKGKKTDQIFIENTKFEFLKMETPYSVPNNYQKRTF